MGSMFFDSWPVIFRTGIVGILAYGSLIILLRLMGKRTLARMNAFDLVVTIALGSTLATILLSKEVTLAQGIFALALLIGLQFAITFLSVRLQAVRRLAAETPTVLLYRGEFIPDQMRRTRVTKDEIRAALRIKGMTSLSEAEAVILETDGSFSVLPRNRESDFSTLVGLSLPGLKEGGRA